jgi:hypothetical protein
MNERIKEMWEEATVSVWPRPGKFTAGEYDHHLKKFAQLIVQRTLEIVEAHTEIFQSDQARAMVEHIKQSVKTDFGVE